MGIGRSFLVIAAVLAGMSIVPRAPATEPLTFERNVRPVLKAYCFDCHGGGEELKAGLDLRQKRTALRGGKSGPAIVGGHPDESLLLERVAAGEMPPGAKKVPKEQVAVIERWLAAGAPTLTAEPASLPPGIDITPLEREFWAFQPIHAIQPPSPAERERARTPIDAFVVAKLRERGFSFAPDADKPTLLRRASFDLTGLPPLREEMDAFLADDAAGAYERMIDRLLDSPHYGERWARYWLDVAGYADSDGDGADDTLRLYAYKYRDYVIHSLNVDKPLDRFVIEQLAGDELVPRPWTNLKPDQIEVLAATGFLRSAADGTSTGAADLALAANQVVADTLKIVGSTLLGMTVGCAQCHDHRYDPIPQPDYYRLRAVFEPALDPKHWRRPAERLISLYTDSDRARARKVESEAQTLEQAYQARTRILLDKALEKELGKFPPDLRGKLKSAYRTGTESRSAEQKKLLAANPSVNIDAGNLYQYDPAGAEELKKDRERIGRKRAEKPVEDFVSVLDEVVGSIPETRVFYRGDHRQLKGRVEPGDLTIAAPDGKRFEIPAKAPGLPTSGRRLAYAQHLVDGKHPLVGRVLANRIWMHHFGRGLVETPGDLGSLGSRPTHPDLLDWLATELARGGWSLKRLHRLIMTSTVYRQSSRRNARAAAADVASALYSRYPIRRLDAEALRDRILAATGRLDIRAFGPPVPVSEDAGGQAVAADNSARRSIYLQVRRSKPISFLAAFDWPVMTVNCERRISSTSAPQALLLMNSDFVLASAGLLAQRLQSETRAQARSEVATARHGSQKGRYARMIDLAWRHAYGRPISTEELDWASQFIEHQLDALGQQGTPETRERTILTNLCQQLLASNEFLYLD
jgi:hypothetical protein